MHKHLVEIGGERKGSMKKNSIAYLRSSMHRTWRFGRVKYQRKRLCILYCIHSCMKLVSSKFGDRPITCTYLLLYHQCSRHQNYSSTLRRNMCAFEICTPFDNVCSHFLPIINSIFSSNALRALSVDSIAGPWTKSASTTAFLGPTCSHTTHACVLKWSNPFSVSALIVVIRKLVGMVRYWLCARVYRMGALSNENIRHRYF